MTDASDRGDALAKLTAAPTVLELNGKRYELSPLTLREIGGLKTYMVRYIMGQAQIAVEAMRAVGAPEEEIAALWTEARQAIKNPLADEWLTEIEPLHEFLLRSLRKRHPDITPGDVEALLADESVLDQMLSATAELNQLDAEAKKAEAARTETTGAEATTPPGCESSSS